MVFNFNYPWLLLLIPGAAAFAILISRKAVKASGWRGRAALVLRLTAFVLLIACMSGFGLKKVSNEITSIIAVDGSDSTARIKSNMEKLAADAIGNKKPYEKIGVVNFGGNAAVEVTPSVKPQFTSVQTKINSNFTNIEQGLKLASSLIPSGDRKRILLVTDGRENTGDAIKQARLLRQQGIVLDVFPLKSENTGEVQLKEVNVPESLHMNQKFEVSVKIDSTVKTKGVLKLYTERQLVAEKNVEIQTGENNFAFSDIAGKGGLVTYTAVIEPETDTVTKNNTISTFCTIDDIARVLVAEDKDGAASELVKMLGNEVAVDVKKPAALPKTAGELQKYDAYIISDVPAEKLDDAFLSSMETCIKHQGRGLLVTGGENSYAPGGYYKTVLEKVLPVNMDIKPKEELPNLGLVLVIDKSGSMSEGQYGISKVELAKEAAIRSTEVLKKEDMIGVIAFDAAVQWVVKTQKLNDLKKIQDAIGTIRADGGTQILPPLEEAYLSLKNANTKLKHIILLTDGQAEKSGYERLIEDINKAGITLSTVAVGSMADTELLEALAIGGNGRFYKTDVFSDIPSIFAKETFLAGKTYLNNRTFTPSLKNYSEILKGIEAIPQLDGYVGTTPKDTASVVFSSDRDDPVLAIWQYGLGRTAAWTPDVEGMWTSKWLQWEQSPKFWKNLVSWLIQKKTPGEYAIKAGMSSGAGTLELTLPSEGRNEGEKISAVMVSPSGSEQEINLDPVSPGVYRGSFNAEETGVYIANVSVKNGDKTVRSISTGVNVPYSPEYDIPRKDTDAFLGKLAYEGGGKVIRNSRDIFSGELPPVESVTDMTPLLLPLVILLFLLDIAVRRLNIPINRVIEASGRVYDKSSRAVGAVLKPIVERSRTLRAEKVVKTAEKEAVHGDGAGRDKVGAHATIKTVAHADETHELKQSDNAHISMLLEKKKKRER